MAEKHEQRIGLTLVELLVTVAIIFGIFGALSYLAHPERILAKSRDAQRLHDITALYKAISLGLSKGELSLVPTNRPGQSTVGTQAVDGTGWASFSVPAGKLGLMLYMHLLPIDPVNTTKYHYSFVATKTDFEIDCTFESPDNAVDMSTDGGNNPNAYELGSSLDVM
jgi:hypothetical protein